MLSRGELTRSWYLERLAVALGKHQDLHMLRALAKTSPLSLRDSDRVLQLVDERQEVFARRAMKLFGHVYGQSTKKFTRRISRDVSRLSLIHI